MIDKQEVRKKLDALQKGIVQHLPAKVVAVQEETCTVEYEGIEVYDVLLRASADGTESKYLIKPVVGSSVMMARVLHGKMFYVDMFSEIEEVEIIANTGISIKTKQASMLDLLNKLVDEVKSAKIDTAQGPGTISAATKVKLQSLKTEFKKLLK